jgi:DNA-binding transcriptional LysR family regulator
LPKVPLTLIQVPAAEAAELLRDRGADAVLLRLPIDQAGLHAIPLYTETTVVVIPKDHVLAAADEASAADLTDVLVLHPLDDTLDWDRPPGQQAIERPATTGDAIELVAAGVGLLVVPQSLARLHHRRDLTYRPITDTPESRVALSWLEDETTDVIEQFIGIVRGRTGNSTRGNPVAAPKLPEADKQKATAAKHAGGNRRGRSGTPQGGKRGKPRHRS